MILPHHPPDFQKGLKYHRIKLCLNVRPFLCTLVYRSHKYLGTLFSIFGNTSTGTFMFPSKTIFCQYSEKKKKKKQPEFLNTDI